MKESELLDTWAGKMGATPDLYAPLRIALFCREEPDGLGAQWHPDAALTLEWSGASASLLVSARVRATPRQVTGAIGSLRSALEGAELESSPALLLPYLSERSAALLEGAGVSALDLNGNYLIVTPGLVAVRLDRPNAYPTTRAIRRIYSAGSSLIGRFLIRDPSAVYERIGDVHEGIIELGGSISLSTVSKVLAGMHEDVVVDKRNGRLKVLQPGRLIELLDQGYRPPRITRRMKLRLSLGNPEVELTRWLGSDDWVLSGESSAPSYVATTPPRVMRVYARGHVPWEELERELGDVRFYNCELCYTEDDFVFFDKRGHDASPVETYLALMKLDKRERELASDMRGALESGEEAWL